MLVSSKIYYEAGKDTAMTEGSLRHKVLRSMGFDAGHFQDGNKMSVFRANVTK